MSLRDIAARLASLGKRDAIDAELAEEMREHLRMMEEEKIATGVSPREARESARRAFGNPTSARERSRDSWGFDSLDAWIGDVRFGARVLRKQWASTLVAVLALGVGIGATTAAVAVLDSVVHRRYGYVDPQRIILLWVKNVRDPSYSEGNVSPAEARLWATSARDVSISSFGREHAVSVVARGAASRVMSAAVGVDLLPLLGVRPSKGRGFATTDGDDVSDHVAMVSHAFWVRALGGLPSAVGETILVDRERFVVIGVLPPNFELPTAGEIPLLVPMRHTQWNDGVDRSMTVVGRLSSAATRESIEAQLQPVSKRFTDASPSERGKWTVNVETLASFGSWTAKTFTPFLMLAWMVLLVACANVAILLLARIPARENELAIRMALGAGSRRLLRQLSIESALIVVTGAAIGLSISGASAGILARIGSASNFQLRPTLASPVVGVAICSAATTCLLFGIAPALRTLWRLRARPIGLISGARSGQRRDQGRLRAVLIAAEVAVSVVLLAIGALLVESMIQMQRIDVGFDAKGLVVARVSLDTIRYPDSESRQAFIDQLLSRLAAHRELRGVAAGTMIPLASAGWTTSLVMRPDAASHTDTVDANTVVATPGYFTALGIPVAMGSEFDNGTNAQSVIINENLATRLWPGSNPIGRRLQLLDPIVRNAYAPAAGERTVVGVVPGPPIAVGSPMAKKMLVAYVPYAGSAPRTMSIAVHARTPASGAMAIRSEVAALDQQLPVFDIASIDDLMNDLLRSLRLAEGIGEVLASIGLALTLVGIYSVVAVIVAQRTHEIGIRLAIGATTFDVVHLVSRGTLVASAIGSAVGIAVFVLASRILGRSLLAGMLFETHVSDPRALAAAVGVLITVVFLAAYGAARGAAKLDPLTALRTE